MFTKNMIRIIVLVLTAILLVVGIGVKTHQALADSEFSIDAALLDQLVSQQAEEQCAGPLHRAQIFIRHTKVPEFGWQVDCDRAKITLTYPGDLVVAPTEGYAGYVVLRKPRLAAHYSLRTYSTSEEASDALAKWNNTWRKELKKSPMVQTCQVSVLSTSVDLTCRDTWGLPEWKHAVLKGNKVLTVDVYALPVRMPIAYFIRAFKAGHKFHPADENGARLFSDKMLQYLESAEMQKQKRDIPFSDR